MTFPSRAIAIFLVVLVVPLSAAIEASSSARTPAAGANASAPALDANETERAALNALPLVFWTNQNMGNGSGLDADTVDGFHAVDLITGLGNETIERAANESEIRARIADESARLDAAIAGEAALRADGDASLAAALAQDAQDRAAAISSLREDLAALVEARAAQLLNAINDEASLRAASMDALAASLAENVTILHSALGHDTQAGLDALALLSSALENETAARAADVAAAQAALLDEANARSDADASFLASLDRFAQTLADEAAAREAAVAVLAASLENGTVDLQGLSDALAAEAALRQAQIDDLTARADSFTVTLAGDVTGEQGSTRVGALLGRSLADVAPASGQVLKWDGSAWAPATDAALDSTGIATCTGATQKIVWDATTSRLACATDKDTTYAAGTGLSLAGATFSNTGVLAVGASGVLSSTGGQNPSLSLTGIVPIANGGTGSSTGTAALSITGTAAGFTGSLAGDITGTQGATQVAALRGFALASTAPASGQVLRWNGSAWAPSATSSGTVTSVSAGQGLAGGPITSAGTLSLDTAGISTCTGSLQKLLWDSVNGRLGCGSDQTGVLSVAASGVLSSSGGQNPSISLTGIVPIANGGTGSSTGTAALSITGTAAGFTGSLAGDVTGTQASTSVTRLRGVTVSSTVPANAQVLKYNSASGQWEPQADAAGSGTVTSVAAGAGLTGGPVTSTGTLALDVAGISSCFGAGNKVVWDSASNRLGCAADQNTVYAAGSGLSLSGSTFSVATGGITDAMVASGAGVAWSKISKTGAAASDVGALGNASNTIGSANLQDASVTSAKILDGTIANADISATAAIADSKLAQIATANKVAISALAAGTATNGQVLRYNSGTSQWEPATATTYAAGSGLALAGSTFSVATGGVTDAMVASLSGTKIADGTIGDAKLATITTSGKVAPGAIGSGTAGISITGNAATVTNGVVTTGAYSDPSWLTGLSVSKLLGALPLTLGTTGTDANYANNVLNLPTASATVRGLLSSLDWAIFNAKQDAIASSTALTTGSLKTSLQGGVEVAPWGASAGQTGNVSLDELATNGASHVGFKAPDAVAANVTWTLPSADGARGQVLSTDGAGKLAWSPPVAGVPGYVTSTLRSASSSAPSATLAADGMPMIAFADSSAGLVLYRCLDVACRSWTNATLATSSVATPAIALGSDGLPIVAYQAGGNLNVAHCDDAACLTVTRSSLDSSAGYYPSIAIGTDGLAVISELSSAGSARLVKCSSVACSTGTGFTTLGAGAIAPTSIAIGVDGFPIVAFTSSSSRAMVYHCASASCTSGAQAALDATSTLALASDGVSLAIGNDGMPIATYRDSGTTKIAHCTVTTCLTGTTVSSAAGSGGYLSIAIEPDGLPIISGSSGDPILIHCSNMACTSSTTATANSCVCTASATTVTIGSDGLPFVAYAATNGAVKTIHASNPFGVPYMARR